MRHRKLRGSALIAVTVFTVSAIFSSVLGVRQVHRVVTTPTWVTSTEISAGQIINRSMIKEVRIFGSSNIIDDPRILLGKKVNVSKKKDEPFLPSDLSIPGKKGLSQFVPAGRVLYTLVLNKTTIPHSQLRNGDSIDVLVKGKYGVRTVATDVRLIGAVNQGMRKVEEKTGGRGLLTSLAKSNKSDGASTSIPLVVAVYPRDVYPLANINDSEAVTLVLHGNNNTVDQAKLDINPKINKNRIEVFSGGERKNIYVSNGSF